MPAPRGPIETSALSRTGGPSVQILLALVLLLLQSRATPGVLDKPDPKQMETAPPLGYQPVETGLVLPEGTKIGASSGVGAAIAP